MTITGMSLAKVDDSIQIFRGHTSECLCHVIKAKYIICLSLMHEIMKSNTVSKIHRFNL